MNCLTVGRPALRETVSVSIWTISPGRVGLRPLGIRRACGRRPRRAPGLRRLRRGTGTVRPLATSILRMRPVLLSETVQPSRRNRTPIWPCPTSGGRGASRAPPRSASAASPVGASAGAGTSTAQDSSVSGTASPATRPPPPGTLIQIDDDVAIPGRLKHGLDRRPRYGLSICCAGCGISETRIW